MTKRAAEPSEQRLPVRDAATWIVLAPAVALMLLGAVFIVAPRLGAAIFGVPAPESPGLAYLAAIGLRDIAFGAYVVALALLADRRAVAVALGVTVLIPVGDVLLVAAVRGLASPGHLLLHSASAGYMAAASWWLLRGRRS